MTDQSSREYIERRYRECLERAEQASDPAIARTYREFAANYAAALQGQPPATARGGPA